MAGDPAQLAQISAGLTDADVAALQAPGTVLVSSGYQAATLTVDTADGPVELNAVRSDLPSVTALVSDITAQQLASEPAGTATVWIKVDQDEIPASELQVLLATLAANTGVSAADFESPLMMRGVYQQAINTVMLTVVGLLAISVLIAFVGVAPRPYRLGTHPRKRFDASIGHDERGLRAMLSWEAAIICAVGALLGCGLGMFYGWAGSLRCSPRPLIPSPAASKWPGPGQLSVVSPSLRCWQGSSPRSFRHTGRPNSPLWQVSPQSNIRDSQGFYLAISPASRTIIRTPVRSLLLATRTPKRFPKRPAMGLGSASMPAFRHQRGRRRPRP